MLEISKAAEDRPTIKSRMTRKGSSWRQGGPEKNRFLMKARYTSLLPAEIQFFSLNKVVHSTYKFSKTLFNFFFFFDFFWWLTELVLGHHLLLYPLSHRLYQQSHHQKALHMIITKYKAVFFENMGHHSWVRNWGLDGSPSPIVVKPHL